jgi:hypothetical protein
MKIDGEMNKALLASLGLEAAGLLCSGDVEALANRFGYVFGNGRETTTATSIRDDLRFCLAQLGSTSLTSVSPGTEVVYFNPNATGLLAAVQCVMHTDNGAKVFVDLVVFSNTGANYLFLEEVRVAA